MSGSLDALLAVSDPALQTALMKVRETVIALALQGASEEVRRRVLKNVSPARRELVAEAAAELGHPSGRSFSVARGALLRAIFPTEPVEGAPPAPPPNPALPLGVPAGRPDGVPASAGEPRAEHRRRGTPTREECRRFLEDLARRRPALKKIVEERRQRAIREWIKRHLREGDG